MAEMSFDLDENGVAQLPVNAATDEANLNLYLQRVAAERQKLAAQFLLDTLPQPVTAPVAFVGPDGPLAGRTVLIGDEASGGAKVDTLGVSQTTFTLPTTTSPLTVNLTASLVAFVLACLFGLGNAAAADGVPALQAACECGPDCACGDDCACGEIAMAPTVLLVGETLKAERAPTFSQRRTLHKNRILIKLGLRHALNQQLKNEELDADDRARIEVALDDRQTIEALSQYVTDVRSRSLAAAIESAGDGERPIIEAIGELIRALIPTIIELLKALITMPVAEPTPTSAMLDAPAGWSESAWDLVC